MATRVIVGVGWEKVCKGNNGSALAVDAFRDFIIWGYTFLRDTSVTTETLNSVVLRIQEERVRRSVFNGTDEQLTEAYALRRAADIVSDDAVDYVDYVSRGRKDPSNPMFQ